MEDKTISDEDRPFIVGYGPGGFTMLGMAGSSFGQGMVGSDRRHYDIITRAEPFDSRKPEHQEFIPFRDYALRKIELTGAPTGSDGRAPMEHMIDPALLESRVNIHLVGVGGNGAQIAACLARLDIAMKALGHPHGLHVTAFDADRVSEANVGRQLYSPADVSRHKAIVTIHRLNQFYGFDWIAHPTRYEAFQTSRYSPLSADILVSCVDSRSARRMLHEAVFDGNDRYAYWLDLGNTEATAQVVLGQGAERASGGATPRLPCVTELFPEVLDATVPDDNRPSCSVRVSLASQGLFINDVAVRFGAQLLYELFSKGRLSHHGVVINLDSKRVGPIEVDPRTWERFGFRHREEEDEPHEAQALVEA